MYVYIYKYFVASYHLKSYEYEYKNVPLGLFVQTVQ